MTVSVLVFMLMFMLVLMTVPFVCFMNTIVERENMIFLDLLLKKATRHTYPSCGRGRDHDLM